MKKVLSNFAFMQEYNATSLQWGESRLQLQSEAS